MELKLAYGKQGLRIQLPEDRTTVITPQHPAPLPDERDAVLQALRQPIASRPLRELCPPSARICITFSDITRATPNDRILPWLLEELDHIPSSQILLLNQTGTHRSNSPAELEQMLGSQILHRYRVLNHDCRDHKNLVALGTTSDGTPALLNRHLVEADLCISTGFIEPHFFAGFSGGPKGIIPGCAGLETIQSNHGSPHISHASATFGVTAGNPLWEELSQIARRVGPTFLLNVTLDPDRRITGVFAGDLDEAHRRGTEFVRRSAMQAVAAPFDIVITSNSGYPLDLNLYQGVKGLSAASRILRPGGTIFLACECSEGVPNDSPFDRLLREVTDPAALLRRVTAPGAQHPEQWQAQILGQIQSTARILVHSSLSNADVRACHLERCSDIASEVAIALEDYGYQARVAVLPDGPLTIPYLAS